MISSSISAILELLGNKYVLGTLGGLAALIYAYFKGRSAMSEADALQKERDMAALQSRIRAAEAKNAFLKSKGEQQNANIDHAGSIDELLGLWDSQRPGEGKSSPSDKKP